MPMLDLGTLKIEVKVVTEDSNKEFEGLGKKSKETSEKVKQDWQQVGSTLQSVGSSMTKSITLPILAAATASVKLASDMTETTNKVSVVFGQNAKVIDRWGENALRNFGMAKETALDMASTFGDLGSSMGVESANNYKYSTSLTQLAGDMASFKNISVERAQTGLMGIYTGETEALKGLGIVMTDANLQAYAAANGYTKQYDAMTQAEKVALRYEFVMDSAKNAMGDFSRTSGETANQTRVLGESTKELGAEFGEVLALTGNDLITDLNGLLQTIKAMNPEAKEAVVTTALITAGIGPLLTMVGKGIKAYNDITKAVAAANIKMQLSAGVIGGVSIALGLLAAAVITVAKHYGDLTVAANKLADANKDAQTQIDKAKESLKDNLVTVEANAKMAQTYTTRLGELAAAETLSNAQRAESSYLVDQLNTLYPELNAKIDEQTGKLVGGTEAIYGQITAMRDRATAAAYEEQYTATIAAQADLLYAAAAAETEKSLISQRNAEITDERTKLEQQFQDATGNSLSAVADLDAVYQSTLLDGNAAALKMVSDYRKLGQEIDDNNISLRALDRELDKNKTATTAAEKEVKIATDTYNNLTGASDAAGKSLGDTAGDIADTGDAAAAAQAKIKDYTDETINGFDKMPRAVRMSAEQATANLVANNATMTQWMNDLSTLVEKGMDEGVVGKLYEMGPSFRNVVSDLANGTPEAMAAFEEALGASGDLSGQKFTTGVKESTNAVTDTLAAKKTEVDEWTTQTTTDVAAFVDNGFIANLNRIAPAWSAVITALLQLNATSLVAYKNSMLASGYESGNNFYAGVRQSTEGRYSDYYNLGYKAGRKFVQGYNDAQASKSPAKEGIKSGHNWMEGVTIGVEDDIDMLLAASEKAARVPMDAMQAQIGQLPDFRGGTLPAQSPIYNNTTTTTTNNTVSRGNITQNISYPVVPMSAYEREIEQRRNSRNLAREVS